MFSTTIILINDVGEIIFLSAKSEDNPLGAVLTPVLDIDPRSAVDGEIPAVAVSHVLVADNNASGATNVNVANVNNALIYEVLFRDNAVALKAQFNIELTGLSVRVEALYNENGQMGVWVYDVPGGTFVPVEVLSTDGSIAMIQPMVEGALQLGQTVLIK